MVVGKPVKLILDGGNASRYLPIAKKILGRMNQLAVPYLSKVVRLPEGHTAKIKVSPFVDTIQLLSSASADFILVDLIGASGSYSAREVYSGSLQSTTLARVISLGGSTSQFLEASATSKGYFVLGGESQQPFYGSVADSYSKIHAGGGPRASLVESSPPVSPYQNLVNADQRRFFNSNFTLANGYEYAVLGRDVNYDLFGKVVFRNLGGSTFSTLINLPVTQTRIDPLENIKWPSSINSSVAYAYFMLSSTSIVIAGALNTSDNQYLEIWRWDSSTAGQTDGTFVAEFFETNDTLFEYGGYMKLDFNGFVNGKSDATFGFSSSSNRVVDIADPATVVSYPSLVFFDFWNTAAFESGDTSGTSLGVDMEVLLGGTKDQNSNLSSAYFFPKTATAFYGLYKRHSENASNILDPVLRITDAIFTAQQVDTPVLPATTIAQLLANTASAVVYEAPLGRSIARVRQHPRRRHLFLVEEIDRRVLTDDTISNRVVFILDDNDKTKKIITTPSLVGSKLLFEWL